MSQTKYYIEKTEIFSIYADNLDSAFEKLNQALDTDNPETQLDLAELESIDYYQLDSLLDLTRQYHFEF